jgi:hypothetical protein
VFSTVGEVHPKNQWEFEQRFRTETDCVEYLVKLRGPKVFSAPAARVLALGRFDGVVIKVGLVGGKRALPLARFSRTRASLWFFGFVPSGM